MIEQELTDDHLMTFGKHKGTRLGDLSNGYLLALHDRKIAKGQLLEYIKRTVPVLRTQYRKITKRPGRIFKTASGKIAVSYNDAQIKEFVEQGKVLVELFEDIDRKEPVLHTDKKQLKAIVSLKFLTLIGFID